MTLPTETWTQSAKYTRTITANQADAVSMIKEAIDAHGVDWEVAGYSGLLIDRWVIIKRKGTEDNQRLTIFGGLSVPNTASLDTGVSSANTNMWAYTTTDRPLTTVDGLYTAGDIFSSSPSGAKVKGRLIHGGGGLPTAGSASINIYSTPSTLHINIEVHGTNSSTSVIFGNFIQLPSDASTVACCLSYSPFTSAATSDTSSWFFPGISEAANAPTGYYLLSNTWYSFGRVWPSLNNTYTLTNSSLGGVLHDVSIAARTKASALAWEYVGRLRQIRYGPQVLDRARIYSGDTLAAYHSAPPNSGSIQTGIYMDNTA